MSKERTSISDRITSLGGDGIMCHEKAKETSVGSLRVLELMIDGKRHSANAICTAAGGPGRYATEGLRRMRELRGMGYTVNRHKVSMGTWSYSLEKNH